MRVTDHIHPAIGVSTRLLGKIVMAPIAMLLLALAPIVNIVCGFLFVAGTVAAIAFEVSAVGPRFPFLQVFGVAASFGLFMLLYHVILLYLVRD